MLVTSQNDITRLKGTHSRFLVASLLISRSIRRDSICCFYLHPEQYAILFYGSKMRQLRADEASAFGIINKAVRSLRKVKTPHSGVIIYRMDLESLLRRQRVDVILVRDDRRGHDVGKVIQNFKGKVSSIMYVTYLQENPELWKVLDSDLRVEYVRFPRRYSPEQEVTIVNMLLD